MAESWETDLANDFVALGIRSELPTDLVKWLRSWRLADSNEDAITLDFLRRLADSAIRMTAMLMPAEAEVQILAHAETDTPVSYMHLVGSIIAAAPQHPTPTHPTRRNVAQLVLATRIVARDIRQPDSGTMSPIRTARFLAMWSTIYWELAAEFNEATADSLVYGMFSD